MLTSQIFHGSSEFEPNILERFRAELFSSNQFFEHARTMLEPVSLTLLTKPSGGAYNKQSIIENAIRVSLVYVWVKSHF